MSGHARSRTVPSEFDRLASGARRQAYNYAYRLIGNRDDAEDLVQEALTKAYGAFDRFDTSCYFQPWLNRILYHVYVDRVRRAHPARFISLDHPFRCASGECESNPDIASLNSDPANLIVEDDLDPDLALALNRLPLPYREAVRLRYVDHLSYDEIATYTGVGIGTVRSRLHRGIERLRKSYRRPS